MNNYQDIFDPNINDNFDDDEELNEEGLPLTDEEYMERRMRSNNFNFSNFNFNNFRNSLNEMSEQDQYNRIYNDIFGLVNYVDRSLNSRFSMRIDMSNISDIISLTLAIRRFIIEHMDNIIHEYYEGIDLQIIRNAVEDAITDIILNNEQNITEFQITMIGKILINVIEESRENGVIPSVSGSDITKSEIVNIL